MLEKNQIAPQFSAINQDNKKITLNSFKRNKVVVLYFYPKDDTPGCTVEANDFTKFIQEFSEIGAIIIGVSKDSCQSHTNFIKKFNLKFDLLADENGDLCKNYKVMQKKVKAGIKKMAILRSTFIINLEGILVEAYYGVKPANHAEDVLDRVRQLVYRGL